MTLTCQIDLLASTLAERQVKQAVDCSSQKAESRKGTVQGKYTPLKSMPEAGHGGVPL